MYVPSEPGLTPVTISSEPVHTLVRLAAIDSGAVAIARHGPVAFAAGRSDAEPDPPPTPHPAATATAASARPKARKAKPRLVSRLSMIPPVVVCPPMPRVSSGRRGRSMDGTWGLDGISAEATEDVGQRRER